MLKTFFLFFDEIKNLFDVTFFLEFLLKIYSHEKRASDLTQIDKKEP